MNIEKLNTLDKDIRLKELLKCCGSKKWAENINKEFPFKNENELIEKSNFIWFNLNKNDYLEAFSHHPKIGDIESLEKRFPNTANLSQNEQSGINNASKNILEELSEANKYYENKFGYIFIICATGKTAKEILEKINDRKNNSENDEIKIASIEQSKITEIRLLNLL